MVHKKFTRDTSKEHLPIHSKMLGKASAAILRALKKAYPNASSELNFSGDFQLVVAVVLSAQCTDKKVNQVTPKLFAAYPGFRALSEATLSDLERIIKPINYYKTKARNLIGLATKVTQVFAGVLPSTHEELVSLAGVGRKTANVVLCEQGNTPALPVDTHVFRVSHRLGFSKGKNPEDVERDLMAIFKPSAWHDLHHRLIFHGRRVCKAQKPLCSECCLAQFCPSCASPQPKPARRKRHYAASSSSR